jgi:hypothetical protein
MVIKRWQKGSKYGSKWRKIRRILLENGGFIMEMCGFFVVYMRGTMEGMRGYARMVPNTFQYFSIL